MSKCYLCPRECGADRSTGIGICRAPTAPYVARAALHMWEEPCISGEKGSGAIFFCGCNLACVFCQNHDISGGMVGIQMDARTLSNIMLRLQCLGAHNINFVSPAPFLPVVSESIIIARASGLNIPIVYNTNAYEKADKLKELEGLVDIYLPDLKYVSPGISKKYSGAADYFEYASAAVAEMYRQVGGLKLNDDGLAVRGLIIRHLVLPGSVDETRKVLDHIADNFPLNTSISLMSQYVPAHCAALFPPLDRRLLPREYKRAVDYCIQLGLKNVTVQSLKAAESAFIPCFDGTLP